MTRPRCDVTGWPRWARRLYWTYYLSRQDWEGPIRLRTAWQAAQDLAALEVPPCPPM